jgi:cbb3-type cytochrome oxidase subunit 3
MTWASQRKTIYALGVILFFLLVLGIPSYVHFNKAPTCFDKKQNQNEIGVDCGGVCELLCRNLQKDPVVLWSRSFKVTKGLYNAVAYIENLNAGAEAENVKYTFQLYDDKNVLISERTGYTFLFARRVVPIFEAGIVTGERVPLRTTLTIEKKLVWEREVEKSAPIEISNQQLVDEYLSPRLSADVFNPTVKDLSKVEVTAVVFDSEDNAVAVSKTVVDSLPRRSSVQVVFTWPEAFPANYSRVEIIPLVAPRSN